MYVYKIIISEEPYFLQAKSFPEVYSKVEKLVEEIDNHHNRVTFIKELFELNEVKVKGD